MSYELDDRLASESVQAPTSPAVSPGKRTLTDGLIQRRATGAAPAPGPSEPSAPSASIAPTQDPFAFLGRSSEPAAAAPVQAKSASGEDTVAQLKAIDIWLKAFDETRPEGNAVEAPQLHATGNGSAMPAAVQAKMEHAFGTDLSAVRIHEGPQAASIGAAAYTQGTDLHFAPGQYDPHTQTGQELLGHELTHVVQQAQGRVAVSGQAKGAITVNSDAGLEHEADVFGAMAARGERVFGGGGGTSTGSGAIQRKAEGGAAPATGGEGSGSAAPATGGAAPATGGQSTGGEAKRELTDADLPLLYPADQHIPVSLSAFTSKIVQPAFTAKRALSALPFMIGPAYHEHIFFEDGLAPPNIGFMGPNGLGQDNTGGYTNLLTGLDDARMRTSVANVGAPGVYSLFGNNCQAYVARVVAEYRRLLAAGQ